MSQKNKQESPLITKTSEIIYRNKRDDDALAIAELHATSWKIHYRGIVSDDYLDYHVFQERQRTWEERFKKDEPGEHLVIAEKDGKICGFGCAYTDLHEKWGSYLDNLHVLPGSQGHGIGYQLLRRTAQAVYADHPKNPEFYLWVFEKNFKAIDFYTRAGGTRGELAILDCPDGGSYPCLRYSWVLEDLVK